MTRSQLIARVGKQALALAEPGGLRPRATAKQVAATEKALGFPLHELHRELLLRVANGGFGFGVGGLFGVGTVPRGEESCLAVWRKLGGNDPSAMPAETVPVADMGCATWVLLHAPSGVMRQATEDGFYELEQDITDFVTAWLDGREVHDMLHDQARAPVREFINPFTKKRMRYVGQGPPLGRLILPNKLARKHPSGV